MLLAMEDEARSNLKDEENDFLLDNSYGEETMEELTAIVMLMARIQPAGVSHVKCKTIIQTSYDDQIDYNIIFDDPYVENNDGTSDHDSNAPDEYHEIQMQKELLQKELKTCKDQVKMFESKTIQCSKYKETCKELERELRADKDTTERILKEKDKIQSDFFKIENEKIIIQHETQLAKKAFKERENRYLEDIVDLEEKLSSHDQIVSKMSQSIQTIHKLRMKPNKVHDTFLKAGLGYKNPERLKKAIAAQQKMYDGERLHSAKFTIDSPDLEETLEDPEEKRKNIKLEYQKLFNSIKATQTQHQKDLDELNEHVNQKTYAYADVHAQNQDLLITISELKNKLKTVDNGKNVNTKFDKSETQRTLLCIRPLPKNIAVKAKKVSNTKVNTDRSKPVTSHLTPKNEQSQKHNENVLARGMYRITKTVTQTLDSKTNINVCNSTGVESSNSIRRPKSKDTKSKDRVLKNNNDKRPSAHVRKMSSSVSIDSNKRETMHSITNVMSIKRK
ncbi:hypothetical protein Tco_0389080 [Tanacetum coccineum]